MPVRRAAKPVSFGALLFLVAVSIGCGQTPHGPSAAPSASSQTGATAQPSQRCVACHLSEYQGVSHPPHPGVRPTTCGTCHLDTSWHPYRLDHSWPLEGAHAKANCFDCHRGEPRTFEGTSKECLTCHGDKREQANQKVKHHDQFGTTCQKCHSTVAWKPTLPHEGAASEPETEAETEAVTETPVALSAKGKAAAPTGTAHGAGVRKAPSPVSTGTPSPVSTGTPSPVSTGTPTPARKPKAKPDSVTGASPVWRK